MVNIIKLQSEKRHYDKQRKGLRPNMSMCFDMNNDTHLQLIYFMLNGFKKGFLKVNITPKGTRRSKGFIRKVVDISVQDNNLIISWEHDNNDK